MAERNNEIDLTLDVILAVMQRGQTISSNDIAELCGCTEPYISALQRRAMKKLKNKTILQEYNKDLFS